MEAETSNEDVPNYNIINAKNSQLQSMLSALLDDPVLSDLPKKPSLADVDTLINLELGSAMRLTVVKMDNASFDVVVMNSATVKDLKLAVRKKTDEIQQAKMGHRYISWRYIWSNFCLSYRNEKLISDGDQLSGFGVHNNCKVHFSPCVVSRLSRKHSKRRKHRFFHGLSKRS